MRFMGTSDSVMGTLNDRLGPTGKAALITAFALAATVVVGAVSGGIGAAFALAAHSAGGFLGTSLLQAFEIAAIPVVVAGGVLSSAVFFSARNENLRKAHLLPDGRRSRSAHFG